MKYHLIFVLTHFLLISGTVIFEAENRVSGQDSASKEIQPPRWLERDFWTTIDGQPSEKNWEFDGDQIMLVNPRGGSGSLLSLPLSPNFELEWDWKIGAGTNSGVKYRVHRHEGKWLGLEYQIIDEKPNSSNKTSTGSIYDLVAPTESKTLNPAEQWNHSKIIANGNEVQHFLNGQLITSGNTTGIDWTAKVAKSKFWGVSNFADDERPHRIMLTDHGGSVVYKNFQWKPREDTSSKTLEAKGPQLGNGMKNGWIDQTSAVIWTRTTLNKELNQQGPNFLELSRSDLNKLQASKDSLQLLRSQLPADVQLNEMLGSCEGTTAEIRLSYFPEKQNKSIITTKWTTTDAKNDFTQQWQLTDLKPNRKYATVLEVRPVGETTLSSVLRGSFQTAPSNNQQVPLKFCLTTCHDFLRRDDGFNGHKIYPSMEKQRPNFTIHAGDIEYYDKPFPWALTTELMRFKWNRIFALPSNRKFYSNHSAYFLKDDHDTLKNDCWPGQTYGSVTFKEGQSIFNDEQFPRIDQRYQTIRWGKDLQIWLLEGRDFRSPNNMEDGPEKTILGLAQKNWLYSTLAESSAKYKLIISPTPLIGPDRRNKKDNHANEVFMHEGEEIRSRLAKHPGTIVFCGDRHWQYATQDTTTGLWEFGCGPGSEKHQLGWKEGDLQEQHKFLRVAGGFLSGELEYPTVENESSRLILRHHKVDGAIVSEFQF